MANAVQIQLACKVKYTMWLMRQHMVKRGHGRMYSSDNVLLMLLQLCMEICFHGDNVIRLRFAVFRTSLLYFGSLDLENWSKSSYGSHSHVNLMVFARSLILQTGVATS